MGLTVKKGMLGVLELMIRGVVLVIGLSVVVEGCLITTGGSVCQDGGVWALVRGTVFGVVGVNRGGDVN